MIRSMWYHKDNLTYQKDIDKCIITGITGIVLTAVMDRSAKKNDLLFSFISDLESIMYTQKSDSSNYG